MYGHDYCAFPSLLLMILMPVYRKVVGGERERAERLCLSTESTEDHWPGASTAVELLKQSEHSSGYFFEQSELSC